MEPQSSVDPVRTFKGFRLSRFQLQAVEAVRAGKNVLVSAPTGAGKTLVAEYAIADAVRRGRRCIYTAPIKALSNQKYRDFRDEPDVDVGLMTGDVTIHGSAQVLIMTTEILRNAIFEDPQTLHDVEYVIFDEVHFLDDLERGSVWEESLIFSPEDIRFLCLSATVPNLDQIGAWIGEIRRHEIEVVRSDRRPVPLSHRFWTPKSGLFDVHRLARVRKHEADPPERRRRGRAGRGRSGRGRRERPRREELDLGGLLDHLQGEALLPTLVFSFSRRDCERLASRSRRRDLLTDDEHARMEVLQSELIELFQLDEGELRGEVFQLARRGIGYHHAGMLPVHKEVVERMFTSGLLKLIFTTETFALGINMPARTVVFTALRKFDGVTFDYMRARDYQQMAGRAGRQGIDSEGLVISALDERALREAPVERYVAAKLEPVWSRFRLDYSTLLHLVTDLGRERVHEAWEKSFNQFQHRGKGQRARERNRRIQRHVVEDRLSFLREEGYLEEGDRLTPKGEVARNLHGYEIQVTELLWRGSLENLSPGALAAVFVALIHEERRRHEPTYVSSRLFGGVRRHVGQVLYKLTGREADHGVMPPLKPPDWALTPALDAWVRGASIEELEEQEGIPGGDIVRSFRMALQLMRQTRKAVDPAWDVREALADAIAALDRDEVDARRQLELG